MHVHTRFKVGFYPRDTRIQSVIDTVRLFPVGRIFDSDVGSVRGEVLQPSKHGSMQPSDMRDLLVPRSVL